MRELTFIEVQNVSGAGFFSSIGAGVVGGLAGITSFGVKWAMSGDINQDKVRIVYENDEVGIHHAFVTFNDGNVEAVMAVYKYDNGKIISLETGATPMPK